MACLVKASFLAGFGVIFAASILNLMVSRFTAGYQKGIATSTDNRMKTTN